MLHLAAWNACFATGGSGFLSVFAGGYTTRVATIIKPSGNGFEMGLGRRVVIPSNEISFDESCGNDNDYSANSDKDSPKAMFFLVSTAGISYIC